MRLIEWAVQYCQGRQYQAHTTQRAIHEHTWDQSPPTCQWITPISDKLRQKTLNRETCSESLGISWYLPETLPSIVGVLERCRPCMVNSSGGLTFGNMSRERRRRWEAESWRKRLEIGTKTAAGGTDLIEKSSVIGDSDQERSGAQRLANLWRDREADELGEYYMRKYASSSSRDETGGEYELSDDITQQGLLPGVKDPNLWTVKCRIGEEKQTAIMMMRKFIALQYSDEPLQIKSIVAKEGLKGYVYVESFKQTHVKQAITGVGNLRLGLWQQQMVPIKEMTDVLKVVKETVALKPKSWVRLKRGVYKDDLAQVDYVEPSMNSVHLKLIPRVDYTKLRGVQKASQDQGEKRKKFRRPPQKLFDVDAIRAIGGEVTSDGDFLIFEGNRYSRKGFLFKTFVMSAIITEGVKPTLSELEKFEDQPEGMDIELVPESRGKVDKQHSLAPGDIVEVAEGELIHLQGKVMTVDGNKVTIMPKHEDLKEPLEFPSHELRKHFNMGDHVKVIAGRYEGDTGLIVRVEDNYVGDSGSLSEDQTGRNGKRSGLFPNASQEKFLATQACLHKPPDRRKRSRVNEKSPLLQLERNAPSALAPGTSAAWERNAPLALAPGTSVKEGDGAELPPPRPKFPPDSEELGSPTVPKLETPFPPGFDAASFLQWISSSLGLPQASSSSRQPRDVDGAVASTSRAGVVGSGESIQVLKWKKQEVIGIRQLASVVGLLESFVSADTQHDLLRLDNATAVAYVNHVGGTRSPDLAALALEMWSWALVRGLTLSATSRIDKHPSGQVFAELGSAVPAAQQETPSAVARSDACRVAKIRRQLQGRGLSAGASDLILSAWRESTSRQYQSAWAQPGKSARKCFWAAFPQDRRLCAFTYLKEYLRRTSSLRKEGGGEQKLFISFSRPHRPVGSATLARWVKSVLGTAGVDTATFSAHSTRGASTSAATAAGVSLHSIMNAADWSRESTFLKYYRRDNNQHTFDQAVLSTALKSA
ncbi:Transcription elongation factor SPT5 [Branchiostoma belcheri]|nr:Transcription elongation factor SPT5 [Branchiostoma belcheri]